MKQGFNNFDFSLHQQDSRFANVDFSNPDTIFEPTSLKLRDIFYGDFINEYQKYDFDMSYYEQMADYCPVTQEEKMIEIGRCARDPIYFIYKYITISSPNMGGYIKFKLWDFQAWFIKNALMKNKYNVVIKARQLGLTTLLSSFILWNMIFIKNFTASVISYKGEVANEYVEKIKVAMEHLPSFFFEKYGSRNPFVKIGKNNVKTFALENGSYIKALPLTKTSSAGAANSFLVLDEWALAEMRSAKEVSLLWQAAIPTLTSGEGGRCCVVSTPRVGGGVFYNLCQEGRDKPLESLFKLSVFAWYSVPNRDLDWFKTEYYLLSQNLKEGFDDPSVGMSQEYLCSFKLSGETVVSSYVIERIKETQIRPPITKEQFDVWIWEQPNPDTKYALFVDCAKGGGGDYSTFIVFDVQTKTQVAEYMTKHTDSEQFANIIVKYAKKYNNAFVCIENNNMGVLVIHCVLRDFNYDNIVCHNLSEYDKFYLYKELQDEIQKGKTPQLGFSTNAKSRPLILTAWRESIESGNVIIRSIRLLEEIKVFVWLKGKAQAASGFHDDLIIPCAQYALLADQLQLYKQHHKNKTSVAHLAFVKRNTQQLNSNSSDIIKEKFLQDLMG